jgi:hypothetical protein
MDDKLFRKINAAFYSAIMFVGIYGLILLILSGFSSELFTILIVSFFVLIGNFMYAIPVSILSDKLTKKFTIFRFGFSAFLHIFFAFLTYFIIGGLSIYALACAVLFLLTDEWLCKDSKRLDKKGLLLNGVFLILIVAIAVFYTFRIVDISEKETHDYYLIPMGYEGEIIILHNIKHAPKPQKIDGYKVIKVNEQGYGITFLPESEGIIENKYYYIDELGIKEKINDNCVQSGGSGAISGDGYEYSYSTFTITATGCGEAFMIHGNNYFRNNSLDIEEILLREGLAEMDGYYIRPKPN